MQATVRVEPFDKLKTGCAEAKSKHERRSLASDTSTSRYRATLSANGVWIDAATATEPNLFGRSSP